MSNFLAHIEDELHLERECRILRMLVHHPCIIDYYGLYEEPKHYMMVTEYMGGGELLDVLVKRMDKGRAKYTEAEIALILLQVRAIRYG